MRLQAELHAARRRHALLEAVTYGSLPPSRNWEHMPDAPIPPHVNGGGILFSSRDCGRFEAILYALPILPTETPSILARAFFCRRLPCDVTS